MRILIAEDDDISRRTLSALLSKDGTRFALDEYPVTRVIAERRLLKNMVFGIDRPSTGDRVWVLVNAFPEFDEDKSLRQVVVTFADITERKLAEGKLEESEERFRSLVESIPNVSAQGYNRERQVIFWNKASEALYGYSQAEH